MCYISTKYQPPNNWTKCQYFYTKDLLFLLHFENKLALSVAKIFQNLHFLFPFSLFLTVSEVCNISNKYWLPNKSATKMFLHETPYTVPSFQQKYLGLDRRRFQKDRLFTIFLPNLTEGEVCNISNKDQSRKSLWTYYYFYARDFITFFHFADSLKIHLSFFS